MTDKEIEVVAEELAKVSGMSWYPGREPGPLMRVVSDRYRAQARAVIAAVDRIRSGAETACSQDLGQGGSNGTAPDETRSRLRPGATVIYRPSGDRRAYPRRVVEIQGERAYLAPILRTCVGWISIERLQIAAGEPVAATSSLPSGMRGDSENGHIKCPHPL